ncbi:MAG: hypothetical protein K2W94_05735 [Alphaproteobacteria bacterium]|nr:hypothetical protein [Alphaproteobacteria bacterium]
MTKTFFQILFVLASIFGSFSAVIAMDEEVEGKPRTAENSTVRHSCGLGLSNLSVNDQSIAFSDEAKRAWGLYHVALWRTEVLEQPMVEFLEKFRNYGNTCIGLVREKQCREEAGSSEPLSFGVINAHEKALHELTGLLGRSELSLLEALAKDKEHRAYKLTKGHEIIKGLLEVKDYKKS